MDKPAEAGDELDQLRRGERSAWESFYSRTYPAMVTFAERRLGNGEIAKDCVSETMARVVASKDAMYATGVRPDAWAFGVLHHVVVDAQRRTYRDQSRTAPFDVAGGGPLETIEQREEHDRVRAAFANLDERDRDLLELRVVAGLSSEEVAKILGMRSGTVRQTQARALARLRMTLEGE